MVISAINGPLESFRENAGLTNGSETIYLLDPAQTYVVDCVVTSAGTATLKTFVDPDIPTDFSEMSEVAQGTQTVNFSREVKGCTCVGLDVATGTWTVKVRRV